MAGLAELKTTFVVYFLDVDPDTGFVSQMKPVAYTEDKFMAEAFVVFLNQSIEYNDEPCRTYKSTSLYE